MMAISTLVGARCCRAAYRRQKGITLIELIMVVAIVGILAAIAYPSYRDQVIKSRRTDGTAALMRLATQLEKYAYSNGTYTTNLALLPAPVLSREGYYQISVSAPTTNCPIVDCYQIQAAPVGGLGQDEDGHCLGFILNSTGEKDVTGRCASGTDDCVNKCW